MRFSLVATVFIPVLSAAAADIVVTVGANNQLAFGPPNVTAQVNDNIIFQFQSKNHSVTQSTFASPCTLQTTPALGIDSGFQPVAANSTEVPEWSFTVNNASAPLWFFCAQTIPADHCQMGMVFSVNANPNSAKSFAVFQAAAMGSASGGPPPAGAASIAASVGGAATSDAASFGSEATSFGASVLGDATSAAAGFGSQATSVGASIVGDATAAVGSLFGGGSSPSPTSSAGGNSSSQTGAGFRLERSVSLPVLAVAGLAGVLLL